MRLEFESSTPSIPFTENRDGSSTSDKTSDITRQLEEGIRAAQTGDRVQARALLLQVTQAEPQNENAWLWLASISEYPEELLAFLANVLNINPENERALQWTSATKSLMAKTFVQRGIEAAENGSTDLALQYFRQALENDEKNPMAWMWTASLSDSDENRIEYLERVLALDPDNEAAKAAIRSARQNTARIMFQEARSAVSAGERDRAYAIVENILEDTPDMEDAWLLKSHLTDSFEEKIECYERALEINPDNLLARSNLESLLSILETATPDAPVEPPSAADATSDASTAAEVSADPFASVAEFDSAETDESTQELEYSYVPPEPAPVDDPAPNAWADLEPAPAISVQPEAELTEWPVIDVEEHAVITSVAEDTVEELQERTFEEMSFEHIGSYGSDPEANTEPEAATEYANGHTADGFDNASEEQIELSAGQTEPESAPVEALAEEVPGHDSVSIHEFFEQEEPWSSHTEYGTTTPTGPLYADCVFCGNENSSRAISCAACGAVLTLSDLEMVISNNRANIDVLREAVGEMELAKRSRELTSEELTDLAIGHLNLKNLQQGFASLQEASYKDPTNVILADHLNTLAIRLEELRRQEETHVSMPVGKKILVVDDSATVRKLIAGKLEKCGHEVFCAEDGVQAMEMIDGFVPDLVLLDIAMPRMDGYQVCKLIRGSEVTKEVPVVMISGKDGFFDKVRGKMAGATGYITKPFGPETLMKALEVYIAKGVHFEE